ncbi:MAG: T9SS type A sorting domain-containing protein [Bacteroidota bacterium]
MRIASLLLALGVVLAPAAFSQVSIVYDGTTADSPPTWARPTFDGGPCEVSDTVVPYDSQGFLTDAYDVEFGTAPILHWIEGNWDFTGLLLLYEGTFDPAAPCDNLIANSASSSLTTTLFAGTYVIVTTSLTPDEVGAFMNKLYTTDSNADLRFDDAPPLSTTELPYGGESALWFRPGSQATPDACAASFTQFPAFVLQAFETDTEGWYDIHSEQFEFPYLWDGVIYLYEDEAFRFDPCRNLVASDDDYPTGYYWYGSLIDDVWLDANTRYVLVTTVYDDEDFRYDYFGDHDTTIWGPPDATVTVLDAPIPDLALDLVGMPDEIAPGSETFVDVRVTNNSGAAQHVDAWVELRRYDFDDERYASEGMTQADPVRIPQSFDGVVRYALDVPGRLDPTEHYYAFFKLGTYASAADAGDYAAFRVADQAATRAPGSDGWSLRRLDALAEASADTDDGYREGAYPNPLRSATTIRFTLEQAEQVTLTVYDVTGRVVAQLLSGADLGAGAHTAQFDATGLASGVYVYRLKRGAAIATKRLTVLR